jgi:hypothetical protein
MRKGILAMEELDEARVDAPGDDAAAKNGDVEPTEAELTGDAPEAEAMTEVATAETDVIDTADSVDTAADTADAVEEVRDNVEEAIETEGGVSEPEARALDVAVEQMLVMLGAPREKAKVFPAMEGFKDKATRVQSTRVALEGLSEKLQTIWKAIIANIQKVWESVVAFVKAMVNGTKFVEARAQLVIKMAAKKKGGKAGEISTKGWGAMLTRGGGLADAKDILKGVEELSTNDTIGYDYGKAATEANSVIVAILDTIGTEGGDAKAKELHDKLLKDLSLGSTGDGEEYDLPFGGTKIVAAYKKAEGGRLIGVEVSLKAGEVSVDEKAPGCSPEEAAAIAQAVLKNVAKFAAYEKQAGDIAAAMKSVTSKMSAKISSIKGEDKDVGKEVRELAQTVNAVKNLVARASTLVRGYDLKCCHAALKFAGASVASVGKEAKAEKTEAAPAAA